MAEERTYWVLVYSRWIEEANWPSFVTSITEASVAKSGQSKTSTFAWNSGETQLTTTRSGYLHSSDSSATSYVTTSIFDSKHRLTEIDGPVATIKVLSNRADLVSGGDALVEVVEPAIIGSKPEFTANPALLSTPLPPR